MMNPDTPVARIMAYHEETKHAPHRYARSLGYLDWATQPDPFRRYAGCRLIPLDREAVVDGPRFDDLYSTPITPAQALNRASLSHFFYHSLAISAWKRVGHSEPWPLRVNPSSGNLHPTEAHLIAGPIAGFSGAAGIFHYRPDRHALEERAVLPEEAWRPIAAAFPAGTFLLGLTSIHWREAWKYGERAFRYCQHDVGHALAAIAYAARLLGWRARLVEELPSAELARLLGIDRQDGPEAEHPDCLILVETLPAGAGFDGRPLARVLATASIQGHTGDPEPLSADHVDWPVIADASRAAAFAGHGWEAEGARVAPLAPVPFVPTRAADASAIIRRRRSAVEMDGVTGMDRATFLHLMARLVPALSPFPWDCLPWPPMICPGIFVHRVEGMEPGVYTLVRDGRLEEPLRRAMTREFEWTRPDGCPPGLPLYRLHRADCRAAAGMVSCQQAIAADGAFSLGMLSLFLEPIETLGAWMYPRLFWESGVIGQVLYLEAEAAGLRGTGIGCFFDDQVHGIFGLGGREFQSLYHFTVGGPLEDARLQTLDPYHHLSGG